MKKPNEHSTGNDGSKPSFKSQSLGPNKVTSTETPPTKIPDVKSNPKPESGRIIPEAAHQVTAKPVESKPLLQKKS